MKKQACKIIARRHYVCGKPIYEGQRYQYIGGRLYRRKHAMKQILAANPHGWGLNLLRVLVRQVNGSKHMRRERSMVQ